MTDPAIAHLPADVQAQIERVRRDPPPDQYALDEARNGTGQDRPPVRSRWIDGASFILDEPERVPAAWGSPETGEVLWAPGEPMMIVGPEGVGKGTLLQQLADRRAGIVAGPLLNFAVETGSGPVVYIAGDRPKQIARSWKRMATEGEREARSSRLLIWSGPLPFDLGREPERFVPLLAEWDADTVIIDSLGALVRDLKEAGQGVAYAMQDAVAAGIEVVAAYHPRKASGEGRGKRLRALDDVYGDRWITAACGSVLALNGEPGDSIVEMSHLKQPASEVGPLKLRHDHERGRTAVYEDVDLVAAAGEQGITARDAAKLLGATEPSQNEIEKARRKLDKLLGGGRLVAAGGERGADGQIAPKVYRQAK